MILRLVTGHSFMTRALLYSSATSREFKPPMGHPNKKILRLVTDHSFMIRALLLQFCHIWEV
jgi:hypothetical protein